MERRNILVVLDHIGTRFDLCQLELGTGWKKWFYQSNKTPVFGKSDKNVCKKKLAIFVRLTHHQDKNYPSRGRQIVILITNIVGKR